MKNLAYVSLLSLAACASSQSGGDAGAPKDMATRLDLATVARDLATPGGDDSGVPTDDGGASCMQLAQWPTMGQVGNFDATNNVTYALLADAKAAPFNGLSVEDYHAMGAAYPKTVNHQVGDTYAKCDVCTLIYACDAMGCKPAFFAQGGTTTVTQSDTTAQTGVLKATGTKLTLVEWDFTAMTGDKPVPGGRCYQVGSATWNVMWNHPTDGGVVGSDAGGSKDAGGAGNDGGVVMGCHLVVNELQTAGAAGASDEFVELYNPCPQAIPLTGYKLVYRSAGNNSGGKNTTLYTFASGSVAAGGYFVAAGTAFTGSKDVSYAGGMASTGGAVGILDANGTRVDSVSYDVLTTANALTEGAPAPNPPTGQSIERLPNGIDTDNNKADFKVAATPTPKALNK